MVGMGINIGLIMLLFFGIPLYGNIKRRLSVTNWEELEMESIERANQTGKNFNKPKFAAALGVTVLTLNLLFAVSVLSKFQDYLTFALVAVLLFFTARSVLEVWDTRNQKLEYKRKTAFMYIKAFITVGAYAILTGHLVLSLFS